MEITYRTEVARLAAIKKAAYRLATICDVEMTLTGDGTICRVVAIGEIKGQELLTLFRATVLDYELREEIEAKTSAFRNALLAIAFAPLTRTDTTNGEI